MLGSSAQFSGRLGIADTDYTANPHEPSVQTPFRARGAQFVDQPSDRRYQGGMAALRNLKQTMPPTGRFILVRQMVGGDPRQSRTVEVRLGCREDRLDFNPDGFCMARLKGRFDQCGRRPRRGRVVCPAHGGGCAAREEGGWSRSAREAGALSGFARRVKRDGRVDLHVLPPPLAKLVKEHVSALRATPEHANLQEDILALTAMSNLVLSGKIPGLTVSEVATLVISLANTKARVLLAKHKVDRRDAVPAAEVYRLVQDIIDVMIRHVPPEGHVAVGRELALLAARKTPPETPKSRQA